MYKSKGLLLITASSAFILISSFLLSNSNSARLKFAAASFTDCLGTPGSIIQESYPETCITKDGQRFVRLLEDIDSGESCAYYTRFEEEIRACATCGDGLCDSYETCTASSINDELTTDDCGPLYCPTDCEEE